MSGLADVKGYTPGRFPVRKRGMKLLVAAENSALADVLELFFLDHDGYQFLSGTGNSDHGLGELLHNPALLVAGQAFSLSEYDDGHDCTFRRVGRAGYLAGAECRPNSRLCDTIWIRSKISYPLKGEGGGRQPPAPLFPEREGSLPAALMRLGPPAGWGRFRCPLTEPGLRKTEVPHGKTPHVHPGKNSEPG